MGVQRKTEDADAAKHWVESKVAPAGRVLDDARVTPLHPPAPVALTMKRIVEPALTVRDPGTDNVGGETTVSV